MYPLFHLLHVYFSLHFLTFHFNHLKTKRRPLYLKTQSVPRCKHFHLGYKNQSVYAVSGTSRCLFSDKYKTHKYSVDRAYSCWMLNCWCITWTVGFKRLTYSWRPFKYLNIQNVTVVVTTNHTLIASTWNYVRYARDYIFLCEIVCCTEKKGRQREHVEVFLSKEVETGFYCIS